MFLRASRSGKRRHLLLDRRLRRRINTAGNWTTTSGGTCGTSVSGAVPGTSDIAVFDSGCTYSATIDTNWNVGGITISTGYSGTITQAGIYSVTVGSSGFSQAAGTFVSNPSTNAFASPANFILTGGTFDRFTGAGTSGSPYLIYDLYGLQAMTDYPSSSLFFQLNNDIDASSSAGWNSDGGFAPIGSSTAFQGTFNGNNHALSNLTIYLPGSSDIGLLARLPVPHWRISI